MELEFQVSDSVVKVKSIKLGGWNLRLEQLRGGVKGLRFMVEGVGFRGKSFGLGAWGSGMWGSGLELRELRARVVGLRAAG